MTVMRKAANAMLSLVVLTAAVLAQFGLAASAATVLSIGDGDTISVLEGGQKLKVRLACIDAPETAQTPFGVASRNQLKALLPHGSTVSLRVQAVDRYGRRVAEVIGKGIVNLAMVQSGQAFVYRQYLGRCDRGAYMAAERQAQAQRLGVWAVPGGMTRPWDFRHVGAGHRSAGSLTRSAVTDGGCPGKPDDLKLARQAGELRWIIDGMPYPGPKVFAAGTSLSRSQWGWAVA